MRINTTLQVSRLQKWSEAFLLLMVSSILIFSEIPLWGKGLALIFMGLFIAYQRWLQPPAVRLVQLIQFDKVSWRWSVLDSKKTNVVEGRLISTQGWFFVLVLRFETVIKNKPVMTSWVIWRDQVDADHWRRLIVIVRFWADDAQRIVD